MRANSLALRALEAVCAPSVLTTTSPEAIGWRRARDLRTVDLPEPLGPSSAVTAPGAMDTLTSWTTGVRS